MTKKAWLWIVVAVVLGAMLPLGVGVGVHCWQDHQRFHALEQQVAGTFAQIHVGPDGALFVPPPTTVTTSTVTSTSLTTIPTTTLPEPRARH